MTDEEVFKHCESCGYETENVKYEFHKVKQPNSQVNVICDFCFNNTMSLYSSSENLTYSSFAQGMNYLLEQIREKK